MQMGDIVIYHMPYCDYPAIVCWDRGDGILDLCVLTVFETGPALRSVPPGVHLYPAEVALAVEVHEGPDAYQWSRRDEKEAPDHCVESDR